MKYTIKRKRLPQARIDQVYTLTIYMGHLGNDGDKTREAKVQYPVISHRDGLCKYRELRRLQRILEEQQDAVTVSQTQPQVVKAPAASRSAHSSMSKKSKTKRSSTQSNQMPVAV